MKPSALVAIGAVIACAHVAAPAQAQPKNWSQIQRPVQSNDHSHDGYEFKTRWNIVVPAAAVGISGIVAGSIMLGVAESHSSRITEISDDLDGQTFGTLECAPGTPHLEACAELNGLATDIATLQPLGGGLLVGGTVLSALTLIVGLSWKENVPVVPDANDIRVSLSVTPSFQGATLVGEF